MASGTGSLMEHRKPNLIQGLARGSHNKRLKRTFKQEKVQQLQQDESRLRAEVNNDFSMIPFVDRDITNLQDRVQQLRSGNRESVPAQIMINMIQQQAQQQNLITGLRQEQERQEELNVAGLSGLMSEISRTQTAPPSREGSLARGSVSPSPSRRRRERSRSQSRGDASSSTDPPPPPRSPATSDAEEEPPAPPAPVGTEPPPSGLVQARRGRGANLPISKYNVQNLSVDKKGLMGLPPDANERQARGRARQLGVAIWVTGSEDTPTPRKRRDRDIFDDMITQTALRSEQRIEEIRNRPAPIEPIREESGNETEREVRSPSRNQGGRGDNTDTEAE